MIRHFPTFSNIFRDYPTLSDIIQHYPTLSDIIRQSMLVKTRTLLEVSQLEYGSELLTFHGLALLSLGLLPHAPPQW
jgi:hypothetical protein